MKPLEERTQNTSMWDTHLVSCGEYQQSGAPGPSRIVELFHRPAANSPPIPRVVQASPVSP